jgi:mannitol/fructose-specific phosphotransferase system IIA component (Ntr-type)
VAPRGNSDSINQEMVQWKQRCSDQHNIIKELVNKMADYGIEITEEDIMDMQN